MSVEKLAQFQQGWEAGSEVENFYFDGFAEPCALRRSKSFPGSLSSLKFGEYKNLEGNWVADDSVIWLSMIVSDQIGDGGRLIDALTKATARFDLVLIGEPCPLKPAGWDSSRPFDRTGVELIYWYMRHGFKVIQNDHGTRVVYVWRSGRLATQFSIR